MNVPPRVAVVPVVTVSGAVPSMLPVTSRLVPVAAPIFGVVRVLPDKVCVAVVPTRVSDAPGKVNVALAEPVN